MSGHAELVDTEKMDRGRGTGRRCGSSSNRQHVSVSMAVEVH